jgi:hypothetical protein
VLDVRDRSWILIHPCNYVAGSRTDSEGCILPGVYFLDINDDQFADIAESAKAMSSLLTYLPDKFKLHIL